MSRSWGKADASGKVRRTHQIHQAHVDEDLGTGLAAERLGPEVRHLLDGLLATVQFGHAQSVLPHVVLAVHADDALPVADLQVVVLSLLEVVLALQLVRQVRESVLNQRWAVLAHEVHHAVVLFTTQVSTRSERTLASSV